MLINETNPDKKPIAIAESLIKKYKRDTPIEIIISRKIIIGKPDSEKIKEFILPLITIYPGKVIYITTKKESKKDLPPTLITSVNANELNPESKLDKVMVHFSTGNNITSDMVERLIRLISNHKNDKTLIVINNAAAIFGDKIKHIISNPPERCIIVLENHNQLSNPYKHTDATVEKDVLKNYWAILDENELRK